MDTHVNIHLKDKLVLDVAFGGSSVWINLYDGDKNPAATTPIAIFVPQRYHDQLAKAVKAFNAAFAEPTDDNA